MIAIPTPKIKTGAFSFGHVKTHKRKVLPFDRWLPAVTPQFTWNWQHLQFIREQLTRVTTGEIKRLMLFLPPRHGKSEMTTIRYAVWRLERNPELKIIIGAYNQTLANKFSRKARKIADTRIQLDGNRAAVEEWETEAGGGFRAVGLGAGITGQGGDLIIIDDPVKNREEANSETYRQKVWDWYTDDLYTRLEPGAAIILIMTRWHEDDLAGRILVSEDKNDWTVISLPAEAEENDPLHREPGAALCPDRFNLNDLKRIKTVLGNSYFALYQQRPTAPEGGMFKREWFEIVPQVPVNARRVRYWDKAGTTDAGAFTAGVKMAIDSDGIFYIEDLIRGQWAATEREAIIKQTAMVDGPGVEIWVEQEPGSGGKESAESTIRNLAGFTIRADRVTGDKITRAEPFAAQAGGRNVKLKQGDWNRGYLDRLTVFPFGTYKDDIDASSGAFNKISEPMWRDIKFLKV